MAQLLLYKVVKSDLRISKLFVVRFPTKTDAGERTSIQLLNLGFYVAPVDRIKEIGDISFLVQSVIADVSVFPHIKAQQWRRGI